MIVKRTTDNGVFVDTQLCAVLSTDLSDCLGIVTRQQAVWDDEELPHKVFYAATHALRDDIHS